MSTINMETELVGSAYHPQTGMLSYTLGRDGQHWTVHVAKKHLDAYGPLGTTKLARQRHIAGLLLAATNGPSDEDKAKKKA